MTGGGYENGGGTGGGGGGGHGHVGPLALERKKKHEELKNKLIEDVFGEKSTDRVPIEKVTMLIWHCRNEPRVVTFMARFLTRYAGNRDVFDGIEFYLPQLAHMIIHLEADWDDAVLERFALTISQHSLHFALQLNWILQGAIEDYQPETKDGEPNPSFNPVYYTRCVKLLSKLERSVVYGRPLAQELHRLYEKGKITKQEYEIMELADRRFNAAQIMEDGAVTGNGGPEENPFSGWLMYKRRTRKSFHKRKQWRTRFFVVSDQMLYCYEEAPQNRKDYSQLVRTMPLEGAVVKPMLNAKYPHMFEVHNQYYLFKLRANTKEEFDRWMTVLTDEAEHSALFSHQHMAFQKGSVHASPEAKEHKDKVVSELNPEEHARYTFFKEERAFVRDMCDVAEQLRFKERDDRKKLAPGFMEKLMVPKCGYVPMCNNTDPFCRVVKFLCKDTKVFNTKERCPTIMFYINEKGRPGDDDDIDVADYLHREYDCKDDADKRGSVAVVDGEVFHNVRTSNSTPSTVWNQHEDDDGGGGGGTHQEQNHAESGGKRGKKGATSPKRGLDRRFKSMFAQEKEWLQIPRDVLSKISLPERQQQEKDGLSPAGGKRKSMFSKRVIDGGVDHEAFPVRSVRIVENQSLDGAGGIEAMDGDAPYDPIDDACLERAKRIVCGGETWEEKAERLSRESGLEYGDNREIGVVMAKSNDDVRQEVFVMQMIHYYHSIFVSEGLPIWLKTYRILSTSKDCGLIEFLRDSTSMDGLKKADGYPEKGGLRAYFHMVYGDKDSASFQAAQHNFMVSLVGYSLMQYLLGLKDRHNGNIMIGIRGHITHIDFGFAMGMAPGHEFSIERSPFKFTTEYVEVMGGRDSKCFAEFKRLFVAGFEAARANSQVALGLVEIMMFQSNYPCFSGTRYGGGIALQGFMERLMLGVPDRKIKKKALQLIELACEHNGTVLYDKFQLQSNGIAP